MGRLPDSFAGDRIRARFPYIMAGELTVAFSTNALLFQDVLFTNTVDKPFEVHRLIPRVATLDNSGNVIDPQPDQDELQALVRLDITGVGSNEKFTKAPTLMRDMVKGSSERTWEWAEPYTLPNSRGFSIAVTTLAAPAGFGGSAANLRVEVSFEGFLLQLRAPSDDR